MKSIRTLKRRGFTLIELLVVVLILSILMAVALPLYLSAVSDAQKKTCRANMQTIANAAQATRVRSAAANYSAIITASASTIDITPTGDVNALSDLTARPVCPSAGVYTLVLGTPSDGSTFKVNCSALGHGTFQPGVDSN